MSEHSRPGSGSIAPGRPLRFTVPALALLLGVSEDAVLGQIERGELLAIEEKEGWMIYVDLPDLSQPSAASQPESESAGAEPPHDEVLSVTHAVESRVDEDADRSPALPVPVAIPISPVDLTLLINLVTDLTKRNAELLDSTAQWRERVQHLESEIQRLIIPSPDHNRAIDGPRTPQEDVAADSSEVETERASRLAAEAEIVRLQAELREVKQLQQLLQNAFQDPVARSAAGWRTESLEPEHAKSSWWRRLVGGS
ncbi:MAG TPA: hypothetical protein VEQ36_15410 [Thermomicrobiales bacterium]|nr:hypothetical protein [Thermomicrobiales bacterium]